MSIKNIVLGVAIFVLTMFVAIYGINTFYPTPQYNDFCPEIRTQQYYEDQASCEAAEGKWVPQNIQCIKEPCAQGYCDLNYYCSMEYNDASEKHSKIVFFIALPLGLIIIAVGAMVFGLESVGAGLMLGGVGTIVYGIGGYWQYTDNWLRFVISLLGLILLIWFAYWFNKRMGKKTSVKKKKR